MKAFIVIIGLFAIPTSLYAETFMGLTIQDEYTGSPAYSRDLYKHWIDEDDNDEDTRQEVLIEESLIQPQIIETSSGKRSVSSGLWVGKYTGFVTTNPKQIDIDHLVPLKEVHRSGGYAWDSEKRKAYANDLSDSRTLIAVYRSANRSKADKDPASWMPPNRSYWCEYLNDWIAVKKKWNLTIDSQEKEAIETGLTVCADYRISDHISNCD